MPSPKQNRDYLYNTVLPHMREMWELQATRMEHVLGTEYGAPDDFIECRVDVEQDDGEVDVPNPALIDFSMYHNIYEPNCNIINDKHDCGRTGCFAGWYVMMSEQDRRFIPWDPNWKAIQSFDIASLARHFNLSKADTHDLFAGLGDGIERDDLNEDEYGNYDSEGAQCQDEYTQGEVLETRAAHLRRIMQ